MEKKEFKQFFTEKMKALGFQKKKDLYWKLLSDDYLIGLDIDPSSYCKGYQIHCGMIYLPNELKMPFRGCYDLDWNFRFPLSAGDEFDFDKIPFRCVFDYELYSVQQLSELFECNYARLIVPMYDQEYGLQLMRNDWRLFRRHTNETIEALCGRMNLDVRAVMAFLERT